MWRVIVTSISAASPGGGTQQIQVQSVQGQGPFIEKVLLKAVCKGPKKAKREPKTFTLRNINTVEVCSSDKLKRTIKTQLKDDIIVHEEDFEVGVIQGTNVVSIRSLEDMMDVWKDVKKGSLV